MKTTGSQLLALGAALLLAPLTSTLAQSTWETVDALTPWRGRAIAADTAGNFISLALDNGATGSTGVVSTAVSLSADHGATWQTVGSIPGYALKLAAAPDGTLYASGNRSATVRGKAFVWSSQDHGVTWTASDPWAGQAQTNALLSEDLAAGPSGAVYLCGFVSGGGKWVVCKGQPTSSGLVWSTADTVAGTSPYSIAVRPNPAAQPDQVFVCGNASGSAWTVRRSLDGGATWTTVQAASLGTAYSVAVGPSGDVYVNGASSTNLITGTNVTTTIVRHQKVVTTNYTTTTFSGWLVQKSTDGGATWASVDFTTNGRTAYARSLAADAFGRVFAVGNLTTTPNTWLVRGSADGGATWVTTDLFLPAGATASYAYGIASDAEGNVCVIGDANASGAASSYLAPIRRLAAP